MSCTASHTLGTESVLVQRREFSLYSSSSTLLPAPGLLSSLPTAIIAGCSLQHFSRSIKSHSCWEYKKSLRNLDILSVNEYLTVSSVVMWLLMNSGTPHIRPSWVKAKVRTQKKLASQRSTKTTLKNSTTIILVIKHAYKTNNSKVRTKQALKSNLTKRHCVVCRNHNPSKSAVACAEWRIMYRKSC